MALANPLAGLSLQEYSAVSGKTAHFKSAIVLKLWFFVYGLDCDVSSFGLNISCLGLVTPFCLFYIFGWRPYIEFHKKQ
jgi:hypothetical protein